MSALTDAMSADLAAAGLAPVVDAPFGSLTTWGTGGTAALCVEVSGTSDTERLSSVTARHRSVPVFVMGNGSNTLVSDDGFDGLLVRVRPPRSPDAGAIEMVHGTVTAPGWMPLPVLARRSVAAGACGLEWAVGVPGTVGGAVRMNAGGHGAEIVGSLRSASIVSLRSGVIACVDVADLGLRFRGSALSDMHVVVDATFAVGQPGAHDCEAELADVVAWRRENQPGGRNAGSVFVNPAPGEGSSGALIDSCGLRGMTRGGASVSGKHANFIQASQGAASADIIGLMMQVQDTVADATGTVLRSEVRLVGFDPSVTGRFAERTADASGSDDARARLSRILGESADE